MSGGDGRTDSEVRVDVFGGLRVWRGRHAGDAGPPRQRIGLARLVAAAGDGAAVADLVDVLWPDDPPGSAINQVQRLVGQLRRLLEPDLSPHATGRLVLSSGSGYRIDGMAGDLAEFRRLAGRAAEHLASGDDGKALDNYLDALRISAGVPFAGSDPAVTGRPEIRAVARQRETALVAAGRLSLRYPPSSVAVLAELHLAAASAPRAPALTATIARPSANSFS